MFRKLIILLGLFAFLFSTTAAFAQTASPAPSLTPGIEKGLEEGEEETYDFDSMSTYELFWPIVAGKVKGDSLYSLKVWRDRFMGYLFLSKLKKSEYFERLANKRLVEAEKLLDLERHSFLEQTIKLSADNLEKGLGFLFDTSESQQRFWLEGEYTKDLEKHLIVLKRMKERVGEDQKEVINSSINRIEDLIKKYQISISLDQPSPPEI